LLKRIGFVGTTLIAISVVTLPSVSADNRRSVDVSISRIAGGRAGSDTTILVHLSSTDYDTQPDGTGTVTIKEHGNVLAKGRFLNGNYETKLQFRSGEHTLVGEFSGDSQLKPGSAATTFVVAPNPVVAGIKLTQQHPDCLTPSACSLERIDSGFPVDVRLFYSTSDEPHSHPAPSGNANLSIDGKVVWSGRADGTDAHRTCETDCEVWYTIPSLSIGRHFLETRYPGDGYFTAAKASLYVEAVKWLPEEHETPPPEALRRTTTSGRGDSSYSRSASRPSPHNVGRSEAANRLTVRRAETGSGNSWMIGLSVGGAVALITGGAVGALHLRRRRISH
jgi:hypothetical protein